MSGWMDNWFSPKSDKLQLGTNTRPFLADLVLYKCVVETNLKFTLKIEKESLLKELLIKIQLSMFMISVNFKILQLLNKGVVWALKGTKFIILSAFFFFFLRIDTFSWGNLLSPQAMHT